MHNTIRQPMLLRGIVNAAENPSTWLKWQRFGHSFSISELYKLFIEKCNLSKLNFLNFIWAINVNFGFVRTFDTATMNKIFCGNADAF